IRRLLLRWKDGFEYDFFENPDLNYQHIFLNLHKFYNLQNKKKLKQMGFENSWWDYFARNFPLCSRLNPEENVAKTFPLSGRAFKKLMDKHSRHALIISTIYSNAASILWLLFYDYTLKTQKRPLYILANAQLYQDIYNYFLGIYVDDVAQKLAKNKIYILNLADNQEHILLNALKNGGLFLYFSDTPPGKAKQNNDVSRLTIADNILHVSFGLFRLSAQLNIPILPLTAYLQGNRLRLREFSLIKLNPLNLTAGKIENTIIRLCEPLVFFLQKHPGKWLGWKLLQDFKPLFCKAPQYPAVKQLINTDKLIWFSNKRTTFVLNLENGRLLALYSPIFEVILKSRTIDEAFKSLARQKFRIERKKGEEWIKFLR
ncbi:MAG: hypothetical protein PHV30_12040, partial [Candidatus Margulisbacteria bacterium]|nr:hypothetical protein [Candidatus Margulisiibacteriota bacterium]